MNNERDLFVMKVVPLCACGMNEPSESVLRVGWFP